MSLNVKHLLHLDIVVGEKEERGYFMGAPSRVSFYRISLEGEVFREADGKQGIRLAVPRLIISAW